MHGLGVSHNDDLPSPGTAEPLQQPFAPGRHTSVDLLAYFFLRHFPCCARRRGISTRGLRRRAVSGQRVHTSRCEQARVMREAVIERSAGDVSETFPIESLPRHSAFLPVACPRQFREAPTLQRLVAARVAPDSPRNRPRSRRRSTAPLARPIFVFSSHAGLRFGLCNDPGAKVFADPTSTNLA